MPLSHLLNTLDYSFHKIYDYEETRQLFIDFLTESKMIHIFEFVESVDKYILFLSHAKRYQCATEIVDKFLRGGNISMNTGFSINRSTVSELCIPERLQMEILLDYETNCSPTMCKRNLFDKLYESKLLELELDGFRRFVKTEQFLSTMAKLHIQMGKDKFLDMFVEKNTGGELSNKPKRLGYSVQIQDESDQETDDEELMRTYTPHYIAFNDNELPSGITSDMVQTLLCQAMHPTRGVANKRQTSSRAEKIMDALSLKSTQKNSSAYKLAKSRQVFSGSDLVDFMLIHFRNTCEKLFSRQEMISLARLLAKKMVFASSKTVRELTKKQAKADVPPGPSFLLNISALSDQGLKKLSTPFQDTNDSQYVFLLKKKLAVVGSGMGGMIAAKELCHQYDVTVIDRKDKIEFMFGMTRLVGDPESLPKYQLPILDAISTRCNYVQGVTKHVSETAVFMENGQIIPFDYLILATGSSYACPFPVITHSGEEAATIIYPYSSTNILEHMDKLKSAKSIAVIGGGPVAVEFLGEIAAHSSLDQQITLIAQCDILLERLCSSAHDFVFRELSKYSNLKCLFNRRVTQVIGNRIEFCFNHNSSIEYLSTGEICADVILCCVGNLPNTGYMQRCMSHTLTERGYVKVNPDTLQVHRSNAPLSLSQLNIDFSPDSFPLKPVTGTDTDTSPRYGQNGGFRSPKDAQFDDSAESVTNTVNMLFTAPEDSTQMLPRIQVVNTEFYDNIFAIGDIVYSNEEKMAYVARVQATAVAKILSQVDNKQTITPYKPIGYKLQMVSIGPSSAVAIKANKLMAKGKIVIDMKNHVENTILKEIKQAI